MQAHETGKTTIVFFDEAVAFGGSVVVLSHLLKHLDRSRYVPLVVTSLDENSIRELFQPGDILERYRPKLQYATRLRWMEYLPTSNRLATRLWGYVYSAVAALVNFLPFFKLLIKVARARPGIIHMNNGTEGLLVSRFLRVPLVWHLHGSSFELAADTFKGRTRAAAFISISRHIADDAAARGAPAERISIVPNPAPISVVRSLSRSAWRQKYGLSDEAIVLAHVGRLVRWKGQVEFLKAFSRVASEHTSAMALIVGDDVEGFTAEYPQEIRQFVHESGLDDRVVFTGHVTNVMELMSNSDIVVHSSIEPEPFGLVIIEAMSAGAAVIASRLGAPTEIIEEGTTGVLVNPTDAVEFANALKALLSDEGRRRRIAEAGQRSARERYSPELFAGRVSAVYEGVSRGGAHQQLS